MRPGQQNKRGRGRGNNNSGGNGNNFNRKGSNPLTRTYDSSGPDVKIRGTAQHIAEKYAALARDAQSAGDRVMAENYLQHAEHYNRIIAAAQAQLQERFHRDDRSDYGDRDGDEIDTGDINDASEQPEGSDQDDMVAAARPQHQPREQRQHQPREHRRERPDRQDRPVQAAQPIIDDSTPQPVIEGTPAEVAAMEAPAGDGVPRERAAQRRRGAAGRPRRQPRGNAEGAESEAQPAGEGAEPALASE